MLFRQNNITIVSGMFGCVGENYATLETIRRHVSAGAMASLAHVLPSALAELAR